MATCKECVHINVCKSAIMGSAIVKRINGCFINLDEAKEQVIKEYYESCNHFKDRSRFVELKHAEWVEDEDMYGDPIYRCSACSERYILEEGTPTDNGYSYCPNCGAKMDEQALKEREDNV